MIRVVMFYLIIFVTANFTSDEPEKKRYISLFLNQAAFEYKPFQSHSFGVNIYRADAAVQDKTFMAYNPVYSAVYPFVNVQSKEISVNKSLFYKYFPGGNRNFFLSFQAGMTGRGTYSIVEEMGFHSFGAVSFSPYDITLIYKPTPFFGLTGGFRVNIGESYFFTFEVGGGIKQNLDKDVRVGFYDIGLLANRFRIDPADYMWRQYFYKNLQYENREFMILLLGFGVRF